MTRQLGTVERGDIAELLAKAVNRSALEQPDARAEQEHRWAAEEEQGCGGMDIGGRQTITQSDGFIPSRAALLPPLGAGSTTGEVGVEVQSHQHSRHDGNKTDSPGSAAVPTGTSTTQSVLEFGRSTGRSGALANIAGWNLAICAASENTRVKANDGCGKASMPKWPENRRRVIAREENDPAC